nr:MTH1187 family thiamine-binding protein [Nitriliruptor alkaliphilus]
MTGAVVPGELHMTADLPVLVAFSVSPMGGSDSVGDAVAACVRIVRDSGLANETNAMFTNVEGPYDEVMAVVRSCIETCAEIAPRVSVTLKLDHRPGHEGALATKVQRIEAVLEGDG